MSEYHITEYGRQKILKEVVMRAQKLVIDMMWYVESNQSFEVFDHSIGAVLPRHRLQSSPISRIS